MDIPQRLTPTQKTPGAGRWVTVDVYDNEIYIGQKEGPPTGYPQPIVVFSSSGKLLRSFGADGIALVTEGSAEAYPNPYWGLEKIRVQPPDSATGRPPRLWVMDYENHSIALFSLNGTLLEIMGTPGVPASQTEPDLKKFGYVSHVAFREGMAYVADGERAAGMVNRLTSFDASLSGTPAGPLLVNPSLPPAKRIMETFLTPHSIIYDQPTDLLLVGDRGSLPSGNPSNYRLSPQTGHAAIKLVDWRTLGVVGELRCDALNLTVHMPPIASCASLSQTRSCWQWSWAVTTRAMAVGAKTRASRSSTSQALEIRVLVCRLCRAFLSPMISAMSHTTWPWTATATSTLHASGTRVRMFVASSFRQSTGCDVDR